jgi:hypothetical protein
VSDEQSSTSRGWVIAAAIGIGVMLLGTVALFVWALLFQGPIVQTYTIEPGTGDRLDAGEQVELMPTEVRLSVGDTLVIRNDDTRDFMVGPYQVRAGEIIEQTFHRPQVLIGECSLSGTGEIRIVVT